MITLQENKVNAGWNIRVKSGEEHETEEATVRNRNVDFGIRQANI